IDGFVQAPQEINGFEVFAAPEAIWNPVALPSTVVEIDHGGDGIYPQPIDMVLIEPEQGVAQKVIRHFAPAVVENQRIPISVAALARVGVLIERRAVKVCQPMRIIGEMAGDPVDDDTDALVMAALNKLAELVRRAETAGWRE